MYKMIYWFQ